MTFKLTGWKAISALPLLAGFVVIRYDMQTDALQTDGVEEVRRWLALEATRIALPDLAQAASGSGNVQDIERLATDLATDSFEIVSITRHGMGERIVARVEYRHDARSVAAETEVRYLSMSYSLPTGWRVGSETTRLSYLLAAF